MGIEDLSNFVPLVKPSKGFEELKKEVVDNGLCSGCSTCSAFCDRIDLDERGEPYLKEDCTLKAGSLKCSENGTCYDVCPMLGYDKKEMDKFIFGREREDEKIGQFLKALAVKAKDPAILERAQDGGAVTALLAYMLDKGMIDAAVVADRDENWRTFAKIVTNSNELLSSAGTKYVRTPTIREFVKNMRTFRKIAVVGTGCQIAGFRKATMTVMKELLEKMKDSAVKPEFILIGLFCFENFPYECVKNKIEEEFGVSINEIVKTDITKGKFIIWKKDGTKDKKKVTVFEECVPISCKLCEDFTATFADISVGSIGSATGYSTVIVRSTKGLELLDRAKEDGYIEYTEEVNLDEIKRVDTYKDKKRKAAREKYKNLPLPVWR